MHSSTQRSRHCNELQCPALERSRCYWTACIALHCTELQCTALHKEVGVAMHCNALHWTRSRCHWRACIALHCNVLQCTALHKDVGMLTLLRYTTPHHQHHYIALYYTPAMPTLHLDPCHPATCATHWGTEKGANTFHFYSKVVHWKSSNIPLRCPRYKFIFALYPTLTFPPVTRTEYFPDAKNKGKKEKNEHRCSLDLFLVIYIHWNVKNNRVSRCSLQFISEIWYCRSFGL